MAGGWQSALMEKAYYYLAEKRYPAKLRTTSAETVRHLSTIVVGPLR